MSLFRKPKRNIRQRIVITHEEDDDTRNTGEKQVDREEEDIREIQNNVARLKEKKKEKAKGSVLSFEEDLHDGDDGEIFQVKKSAQSRKLMKQLEKERKKKKDIDGIEPDVTIKKEPASPEAKSDKEKLRILNGRDAEMAEYESSEEEAEDSANKPKFRQPDPFKHVLESGVIPDAAMIHAARKRRQLARETGNTYIPLDDTQRFEKTDEKSRLVRDDDNDMSDEEERINFIVSSQVQDAKNRRDAFLAAQREEEGSESDKGEEMEAWEAQQIRKAVSGRKLAEAQQEITMAQHFSGMPKPTSVPVAMTIVSSSALAQQPVKLEPVCMDSLLKKMKDRLTSLKEVHRRHVLDRDNLRDELVTLDADIEHLESEAPALAKRFKFYQELRGYVTDLVECLDEKVPIIDNLEQRMIGLVRQRNDRLVERRRQDTQDQVDELILAQKPASIRESAEGSTEGRTRRAAEREGRRSRRRRAREMKTTGVQHFDGMSSDDEQPELEIAQFRQQKEVIQADSGHVFEDVLDEFCTLKGVMNQFEKWKIEDQEAYKDAYAGLNIPKILNPLIRLKLITWNPLEDPLELDKMKWYSSLLLFSVDEEETEESLRDDPDFLLVPVIMDKIIIPKVTKFVEAAWDPMSTSQTLRLVGLIRRLVHDYPMQGQPSRSLQQFLTAIVNKMKCALDNDVYIPLFPKQSLEGRSAAFHQRQFWSGVKLMRNLLSWQSIVDDTLLQDLALIALLNRYLLQSLRVCDPREALDKCGMIVSTFPRWWFQREECFPTQLKPFVSYLVNMIQGLNLATAHHRDCAEEVVNLLRSIGAKHESEELLRKYL